MTTDPSPLRQLGPMELWSSSRHSLGIYRAVTVSARYVPSSRPLTSPITSISPRFLAALASVVRAHPMLRVGIVGEETNAARYTHLAHVNLLEHVVVVAVAPATAASEDALDREVTRVQAAQHNARWEDTPTRAPWRLTIVRDDRHNCEDVIFSFHHALLDGTGGRRFHEQLLSALNSALADEDDHVLSLPEAPVLPEPQEEAVAFTLGPLYIASVLWGEFAPAMLKPAPQAVWGGARISFARPYVTRIRAVDVQPAQTATLLSACRAQDTTLTGLLHALAFAYFTRALPGDAVPPGGGFRSATPMGLHRYTRDTVDASLRDTLRVLLCSTDHVFTAADVAAMRAAALVGRSGGADDALTPAVWATAQRVRHELVERGRTLTHNNVASMMRHVRDWRGFHTARDGTARPSSWECSNVGVLAAETKETATDKGKEAAGVKVARVMFSNGAMVTGAAVAMNVASAPGGRLTIALSWQEGVVEESLVEGLGRALEGMVQRFCKGGSWTLE
ncbi:hypothetical protein V2A60_004103 [Cordyceps javanica]